MERVVFGRRRPAGDPAPLHGLTKAAPNAHRRARPFFAGDETPELPATHQPCSASGGCARGGRCAGATAVRDGTRSVDALASPTAGQPTSTCRRPRSGNMAGVAGEGRALGRATRPFCQDVGWSGRGRGTSPPGDRSEIQQSRDDHLTPHHATRPGKRVQPSAPLETHPFPSQRTRPNLDADAGTDARPRAIGGQGRQRQTGRER